MGSSWKDIEHGLRAREEEARIKRNQRRLRGGTHGAARTNLKRGITEANHRLGR